IESDSLQICNILSHHEAPILWELQAIIHDVKTLLLANQAFKVMFIHRRANRSADWINVNARKDLL
ncbi:hypothetical protein P3X46_033850, partial [Hevea brasiliensis]